MEEIWKDIPGFEGRYQASNLGKIKSFGHHIVTFKKSGKTFKRNKPGRILEPRIHTGGYLRVTLNLKDYYIHRLICSVFIGDPVGCRKDVNHKNGIKTDNRVENLEWVTPKENRKHAEFLTSTIQGHKKQGKKISGENNFNAKLSEEDVIFIRSCELKFGDIKKLAKKYNVTNTTISYILSRKSWKHVIT